MTPAESAAVIALASRMSAATTDAQACLVAQTSLDEGAPPTAVIDALVEFRAGRDRDVQRVVSS